MHNDARHFAADAASAEVRNLHIYQITNANMSPRHKLGHYVIFDKSENPQVGDDVIVALPDGCVMTWRLDGLTEEELVVTQYNPPATTTIPRRLVREIYPIFCSTRYVEAWIDNGDGR